MTSRIASFLAVLLLAVACGQHYFVNLVKATATRGTDDFVSVATEFTCEAVGNSTCQAEVSRYCVTANWVTRSSPDGGWVGGTTVATADGCAQPTAGALPSITLRSSVAVPASPPTDIAFTVSGGRNDLGLALDAGYGDTRLPSP